MQIYPKLPFFRAGKNKNSLFIKFICPGKSREQKYGCIDAAIRSKEKCHTYRVSLWSYCEGARPGDQDYSRIGGAVGKTKELENAQSAILKHFEDLYQSLTNNVLEAIKKSEEYGKEYRVIFRYAGNELILKINYAMNAHPYKGRDEIMTKLLMESAKKLFNKNRASKPYFHKKEIISSGDKGESIYYCLRPIKDSFRGVVSKYFLFQRY